MDTSNSRRAENLNEDNLSSLLPYDVADRQADVIILRINVLKNVTTSNVWLFIKLIARKSLSNIVNE